MSLLLSDLELPNGIIEEYFNEAVLEKLRVNKAKATWTFEIRLPHVLPQNVYQLFTSRLVSRYQQFAEVKIILHADSRPDERLYHDYWPYVVQDLADVSSAMRTQLGRVLPEFKEQKLFIPVRSEPEAGFLKSSLCGELQLLYSAYGFPKFNCEPIVQINESKQEALRNQVKQEDMEEAKRMLELQFKREQSRDDDEGPVEIRIGKPIQDEIVPIKTIQDEERRIAIRGLVFSVESRELRSGKTIFTFKMTDYTDSLVVKMFARDETDVKILSAIKKGMWIQAAGRVEFDTFLRDLCMMIAQLSEVKMEAPADPWAGEKRVELHAHSQMSQMDAVMNVTKYVERAAKWGHPAVAITDHAGAQSFPDAYYAGKKNDIKVLYGIEANVVDDGVQVAYHPVERNLDDATFVVFDVETTGLSAMYNKIIELAAVKIHDGDIIDKFEAFADPKHLLSATTIDLTGITDDMVRGKPDPEQVVKEFMDWVGDSILVAHNASFDIGFLNATLRSGGHDESVLPVIDTLELARVLMPTLKNHRLNTLAKRFDIELTQHHRAIYDAEATGYLMVKLLQMADEMFDMKTHASLNREMGKDISRARPYHATVYAKNRTGLKNLYQLISIAHTKHVHRVVRTPRSQLVAHRDGLIIGSACDNGEVFDAALNKSDEDLAKVMQFYDFIEIQPPAMYGHLIEREIVQNELELRELIKKIIRVAEEHDILPVATGNVHYLDQHDATYREILIRTQGGANMLNMRKQLPPAHFRTTKEMMDDFKFLGPDVSERLVITNSQAVAEQFENIDIIPKDLYTPKIEGADEEVRNLSYDMAHRIYGETLPEIVEARLEKELKSIIGHGFAVIYLISHKLVKKSLDDGYLVGSRG